MIPVQKWVEKLNKVDGHIYSVEEEVAVVNGVYEGELQHDNINVATFAVYTGPKLTGERIETYALSTPSLTPWKRILRVYAEVGMVYLSYETDGDTVEAEDVNRLQGAVVETQEALNAEEIRATREEEKLEEGLKREIARAENEEARLDGKIDKEQVRALAAEQSIRNELAAEVVRARAAENVLQENISEEATRAMAAEASIRGTINTNKPNWDDKYTRNEVDNKFSVLETAIDWKESVATFSDIAAAYPSPEDGWTVNVRDTDYTYRYSGTDWVAISANAIPKATQGVDGLLSKEDKGNYDEAYGKRHTHGNKSVIDKITQALLDNWSAAFTHISDAVKHITSAERTKWNAVMDKVDKVAGKGLSTNDYTTAEKTKLSGIAASAEVNVQSDWNVADTASDAFIKNKPTSMPASDVAAWAKATSKPAYSWTEIGSKPSTFPPSTHSHTKSQITDMPTKVSQFTNDSGFITQDDVDTSQNHTHTNKTVLDKVTQTLLDAWNGAVSHTTNQSNPHVVTKAQIGLGSADNKSGATIRSEMTKAEVVKALGYTPPTSVPSYTHPNSGVTAGTYRSVTVNAQGHVTGGTSPTTLAGYGITDAAAKSHNHDSIYLKKGVLTWGDLKGV